MFGCPLYIQNTKKTCFGRLRGCPYAPCIWMPPVCLDAALCLDAPPVCLDAPYVWMAPVCWDAHTFGHPHMLALPHMFGHPHMLALPHMFGCPCKFGCPLCLETLCVVRWPPHVWTPPVCLDVLHIFGCSLYIHNTEKACFVRLRGCPYAPIHLDAPHAGCPPVCLDATYCMGASKHMEVSKHTGGIQT